MSWFSQKHTTSISMNELNETTNNVAIAESWLREQSSPDHISALVRHYDITEVTDEIEQFAGVQISDADTVEIVSRLRQEYGVRPLQSHEMPGYICPDDYPEDQAAQRAYYASREERRARGGSVLDWFTGRS